jgi:NADH pyrophosphatase NudC (nudix superfamily)
VSRKQEPSTDALNIAHLSDCSGCAGCEYLLEFYGACDVCGEWGHKSTLTYDGEQVRCDACGRADASGEPPQ